MDNIDKLQKNINSLESVMNEVIAERNEMYELLKYIEKFGSSMVEKKIKQTIEKIERGKVK